MSRESQMYIGLSLIAVALLLLAVAIEGRGKDDRPCVRWERVLQYMLIGNVMVPQWHQMCVERGR